MSTRTTAVVVSYNTKDLLRRCLQSLADVPVIVVDNASHDGSAEMVRTEFPQATLIANSDNVGFGPANNQGLALVQTDFALLLNADAAAKPGAIEILESKMADGIVAVGGKLLHSDGRLQESACSALTLWAVFCEQTALEKLFPRSRLLSPYWQSSRLPQGGPVEQVMGACLLIRRVAGEFLRFDERFFLYCEDTELCIRLRRHGSILYVPQAEFIHELGASSTKDRWRSVARYNLGKELTMRIHRGPTAAAVCWVLNRKGALLRIILFGFITPKAKMFWKVLFAKASALGRQ